MKRFFTLALLAVSVFAIALPLHAQNGCTDSPENPTAILALAGAAGACGAHLKTRFEIRRAAKKRKQQSGSVITEN